MKASGSRRRHIGAALCLLLALGACGADRPPGPESSWKVEFRPGAAGVAYFDGAVWLGATDDGTYPYFGDNQLLRLDPADGSIDQRIAV
ncbi:MAG: hypothetical protein WCC60_15370, partial [Ilumatobacteraceae bacterium]